MNGLWVFSFLKVCTQIIENTKYHLQKINVLYFLLFCQNHKRAWSEFTVFKI